jgi:hypothetical protein
MVLDIHHRNNERRQRQPQDPQQQQQQQQQPYPHHAFDSFGYHTGADTPTNGNNGMDWNGVPKKEKGVNDAGMSVKSFGSNPEIYIAIVKARDPHARKPKSRVFDLFNKQNLLLPETPTLNPMTPPPSSTTSNAANQDSYVDVSGFKRRYSSSSSSSNSNLNPAAASSSTSNLSGAASSSVSAQDMYQMGGYAIVLFHPKTGNMTLLDLVLRVPGIRRGDMESDILRAVLGVIQKRHDHSHVGVGVQMKRVEAYGGDAQMGRRVRDVENRGNVVARLESGYVTMVMEKGFHKWLTQLSKMGFHIIHGGRLVSVSETAALFKSEGAVMVDEGATSESIDDGDDDKDVVKEIDEEQDEHDEGEEHEVRALLKSRKHGLKLTMRVQSLVASMVWAQGASGGVKMGH